MCPIFDVLPLCLNPPQCISPSSASYVYLFAFTCEFRPATGEEPYSHTFPVDSKDIILEEGAASSAELCNLIVSIELPKLAQSEAVMNEDIVCYLLVIFQCCVANVDKFV